MHSIYKIICAHYHICSASLETYPDILNIAQQENYLFVLNYLSSSSYVIEIHNENTCKIKYSRIGIYVDGRKFQGCVVFFCYVDLLT